jgi:dephospho-CoA kinase
VLKVGLTGNIASGKSTVGRVWQRLGAVVIDADVLAREAVAPGTPGLAQIRAHWGDAVLGADGALDRAAMRDIVFRDPAAKARLETIVHPEVARLRDEAYRAARDADAALVVADIPLLFEVGLQDEFDVIVLVDAPAEVRAARLVRTRGLSREEAERMIAAQMPAEQKRARADYVIENTGSHAALRRTAESVWRELLAQAATPAAGAEPDVA